MAIVLQLFFFFSTDDRLFIVTRGKLFGMTKVKGIQYISNGVYKIINTLCIEYKKCVFFFVYIIIITLTLLRSRNPGKNYI